MTEQRRRNLERRVREIETRRALLEELTQRNKKPQVLLQAVKRNPRQKRTRILIAILFLQLVKKTGEIDAQ